MEQIEQKAKQCGTTKGALSRWILPFDANTNAREQATFQRPGWTVENSPFSGKVS